MFQGQTRSDDVPTVQRPHHGAEATERDRAAGEVSAAPADVLGADRNKPKIGALAPWFGAKRTLNGPEFKA